MIFISIFICFLAGLNAEIDHQNSNMKGSSFYVVPVQLLIDFALGVKTLLDGFQNLDDVGLNQKSPNPFDNDFEYYFFA